MSAASHATATAPAPASSIKPTGYNGLPTPQALAGHAPAFVPRPMPSMPATPFDNGSTLAVALRVEESDAALDVDAIREAVLQAMEAGGSQMLVHTLEEGRWSGEDSLVSIQVEMSEEMIQVSYTREQEKLANQTATRVAGRTVKVHLVNQSTAATLPKPVPSSAGRAVTRDSIKTRAADEPLVKRMMEKFGAEIRIVMDRPER
jgi:hypothetical protein